MNLCHAPFCEKRIFSIMRRRIAIINLLYCDMLMNFFHEKRNLIKFPSFHETKGSLFLDSDIIWWRKKLVPPTGTWTPVHIKGFAIDFWPYRVLFWVMVNPKKVVWTFAATGILAPPVTGFEPMTSEWQQLKNRNCLL